jgi:hypothetical protein
MTTSLILVEGPDANRETLRSLSLRNAKQLVVGTTPEGGAVLHVAATSPADLRDALIDFAQVAGVTGVLTLVIRAPQ